MTLTGLSVRVALAAGAAYAVVLAWRLPKVIEVAQFNPDTASAPMMAELLGERDGGDVVLGNFPWYASLLALRATAWVPGHETLWEVGPYALWAVAVALVVWSVTEVADRRGAALAAVLLGAAAPATLDDVGSWTLHGPTWLHVAVAGAAVVWLARAERPSWVVAVAAGAFAGVGAASDALTWLAAVAPLAVVAVLEPRLRAPLAAAVATAVAVGVGLAAALRSAGWVQAEYSSGLALDQLGSNLEILAKSVAVLADGDVFGTAFGGSTAMHAVCAGVAWIGLPAALLLGLRRMRASPFAAFWTSSAVLVLAAFVASDAPEGEFSSRYLVGCLLAAGALLPLARTVLPLAAGATALALTGVVALARGEATDNPGRYPGPAEAEALADAVREAGARVGYASYYSAAPLTVESDYRLRVHPVRECPAGLCRFELHRLDAWYAPRPDTPTFLVVDPAQPLVAQVPPQLGPPVRTLTAGRLTVYVWDDDIAARMGAAITPGARP